MPLAPGAHLGPYEITGPLGSGGMGEVYRARDTRLERSVAIKILPAHLSSDSIRKQRFEREAKTISSLNHPHICVLHDVGHQDGVDYLVMECVEGETLANRLEKGPLPLEQVLKYGAQIADGLDKAHRAGIVHRDLKPGNIMLTATGAKLLDFGLAKSAASLASTATPTAAVTQDSPVTEQGTIVGTFQYMSPEQVEGKQLDGRSDIFSLGAVLYEMLTGKKAFGGKRQLSVASAILEKDPEAISRLQPLTPPALDQAIRRCLAKDPEDRWQAARDLLLELNWVSESGSQVTSTQAIGPGSTRARWRAIALWSVGSLLLAALTGLAIWNLRPMPSKPVSRLVITLPPGQKLAGLNQPAVALSPDGTLLAYVAIQNRVQQIYLRPLNSLESKPVPGTEGAVNPFFSPDGQWLGFFADSKVKKVAVSGGAAVSLADSTFPGGASWNDQGVIAFSSRSPTNLQQVSEAGGATQPLTRIEKGENIHRWPEFLPGGKAVLFAASSTASFAWENAQVAVQSLATGERSNLVEAAVYPRFAYSGHLIYEQSGNLVAVPFDSRRLAVTGKAVPVVETVLWSPATGAAQYSISNAGSLVYVSGGTQSYQRTLVWVNRNGIEQLLPAPPRSYLFPRFSPDGRRVAVGITGKDAQIWIYDLSRDTLTRLTLEGNVNLNPVWTPDGQRIVFQSRQGPACSISWQRADGSGGFEHLVSHDSSIVPMSMSADGQFLSFIEGNPVTSQDIWILRMSDRKAQPFLQTQFSEGVPQFSPDGRWLSYLSNESGRFEVYVQPYPGPGAKYLISTEGGAEPTWNPNGREIFYRSGDKMMAVDISTRPGFSAGKPHILFQRPYELSPVFAPNYSISPDGQRFLMLKSADTGENAPTQINVVLNWFEELKQRVPSGTK